MSLHKGLICVLKCDDGFTHLIVNMESIKSPTNPGVIFYVTGNDLKPGYKGFHVHQAGNLTNGCASLGPHFNPSNTTHGGLNDPNAHHGDLGNLLITKDGTVNIILQSKFLRLVDLLGRSLVLHSNKDDLGRGGNAESLETGNSGARICCGIIGFA